jgi:hypothetical protein
MALVIDIWVAWAAAFTVPDGPPLPLEFRTVAIDTLTSTLITSAAIFAQTLVLAQRALHSIPAEILQTATYEDLEHGEDMTAWYDPATNLPQFHHYHSNTFDAIILLAHRLLFFNLFSLLYTLIYNSHRAPPPQIMPVLHRSPLNTHHPASTKRYKRSLNSTTPYYST